MRPPPIAAIARSRVHRPRRWTMKRIEWLLLLSALSACGTQPDIVPGESQAAETFQVVNDEMSPMCLYWAGKNVVLNCHTFGGYYGEPSETLRCPQGEVITGLYGRKGNYIDRVGILCAPLNPDGTLGVPHDVGSAGGSGGNGFDNLNCPPNYAASGIIGRSGDSIDAIGLECQAAPFGDRTGYVASTGIVGGNGGGKYEIDCYQGNPSSANPLPQLLTALVVYHGSWVDSLEVRCESVWTF
jgi:hypothetical protein